MRHGGGDEGIGEENVMREYHKIKTVYLRDPDTKFKTLLIGQYAEPEFAYLANNEWVFTEKVDGTNIRVMIMPAEHDDGDDYHYASVIFAGKTDNATTPPFLLKRLQERFYPQADLLHQMFPEGGCLYGEGYGARIQKGGGNYRGDTGFVLFDVKVGDSWLQRSAVEDVSAKLTLDVVPIIGRGSLSLMVEAANAGIRSRWGGFAAEGIVARPATELRGRNGKRIITKIKTKDFASTTPPVAAAADEPGAP
jgi:hypothetical protein